MASAALRSRRAGRHDVRVEVVVMASCECPRISITTRAGALGSSYLRGELLSPPPIRSMRRPRRHQLPGRERLAASQRPGRDRRRLGAAVRRSRFSLFSGREIAIRNAHPHSQQQRVCELCSRWSAKWRSNSRRGMGTRPWLRQSSTYPYHFASPVASRRYQRIPRPSLVTADLISGLPPGRAPRADARPPSPPWWQRSRTGRPGVRARAAPRSSEGPQPSRP